MLKETIKKTRMYAGITQSEMARELFMSESQYCRKENGQVRTSLSEAKKIGEFLNMNENVVEKFWMADQIYDLMRINKDLFYESMKIVEAYFDNYDECIEIPNKSCSFSSLEERIRSRKKK